MSVNHAFPWKWLLTCFVNRTTSGSINEPPASLKGRVAECPLRLVPRLRCFVLSLSGSLHLTLAAATLAPAGKYLRRVGDLFKVRGTLCRERSKDLGGTAPVKLEQRSDPYRVKKDIGGRGKKFS